jgi:hypothetical protein
MGNLIEIKKIHPSSLQNAGDIFPRLLLNAIVKISSSSY